jgi:hypothetical protein
MSIPTMIMVRVRSKNMKKVLIKKQTEWITLSTKSIGLNTNVNGWDRTLKCLTLTIITGWFLHVHFISNNRQTTMIQSFKNFNLMKDSEMSTHLIIFVICSTMSLLGLLFTMSRRKKKKKKKMLFKLIKNQKKLSI